MEQIFNKPELVEFRKSLRNNLTNAEATLWKHLKNSQLEGKKFRCQHSVGSYILDFYCPSEKLAIELDGANHFTTTGQDYDLERTIYLNQFGIRVLRFENFRILEQIEFVLEKIKIT